VWFELSPRIRNWKDLDLFRPSRAIVYSHIDALFGKPGRNVINWTLIETHWSDPMRVVLSIRAGTLSSAALLRRLRHDSRKNKLYRAFQELGRVIRTIVLLRYLCEPELRGSIAVLTNWMKSFNNFCQWLQFGSDTFADNDPDHQEKLVKFNELMADYLFYNTALDLTTVVNDLAAEGTRAAREDLATVSPYLTSKTRRFGQWALDLTPLPAMVGHDGAVRDYLQTVAKRNPATINTVLAAIADFY
jgi:TnpA family transposase